jgi:bromodomain-containing protein 8
MSIAAAQAQPASAAASQDPATAPALTTLSNMAPQPAVLKHLDTRDRLLLAQAVNESGKGSPDWTKVSSLLLQHPLIKSEARQAELAKQGTTTGRIFGVRECERAWTALMRQRNLVEPNTDTAAKEGQEKGRDSTRAQPRTDKHSQLALAKLLYVERIKELQAAISEREDRFE